MFIYNPDKEETPIDNPFFKDNDNNDKYKDIYNFAKNMIYPNKIKEIISIYIKINKDISNENDLLIKSIFEKYIDAGYTNIMIDSPCTYFIIRFNIDYEQLTDDIKNIYRELNKNAIEMKCAIIYESHYTNIKDLYIKSLDKLNQMHDENQVIISNYYEYLFQTKTRCI